MRRRTRFPGRFLSPWPAPRCPRAATAEPATGRPACGAREVRRQVAGHELPGARRRASANGPSPSCAPRPRRRFRLYLFEKNSGAYEERVRSVRRRSSPVPARRTPSRSVSESLTIGWARAAPGRDHLRAGEGRDVHDVVRASIVSPDAKATPSAAASLSLGVGVADLATPGRSCTAALVLVGTAAGPTAFSATHNTQCRSPRPAPRAVGRVARRRRARPEPPPRRRGPSSSRACSFAFDLQSAGVKGDALADQRNGARGAPRAPRCTGAPRRARGRRARRRRRRRRCRRTRRRSVQPRSVAQPPRRDARTDQVQLGARVQRLAHQRVRVHRRGWRVHDARGGRAPPATAAADASASPVTARLRAAPPPTPLVEERDADRPLTATAPCRARCADRRWTWPSTSGRRARRRRRSHTASDALSNVTRDAQRLPAFGRSSWASHSERRATQRARCASTTRSRRAGSRR